MKTWRKVRVVVEVPVLGDYKEKDLRYHVERLVGGSALNTRPGEDKVKFGRVRVMENAAVQRAAARKLTNTPEGVNEMAGAIQIFLKERYGV